MCCVFASNYSIQLNDNVFKTIPIIMLFKIIMPIIFTQMTI